MAISLARCARRAIPGRARRGRVAAGGHRPVDTISQSFHGHRGSSPHAAIERRPPMRRWSGLSGLVMCGLVAGMVALPTQAAAWVAFAKITTSTGTITGGATQKGYEGQIEVLGLGSSLDLPVESSPTTGVSVGRLQLGRFQFVKAFDIATPRLVTQVASSSSLPKIEFTIFKTTTTGTSVP